MEDLKAEAQRVKAELQRRLAQPPAAGATEQPKPVCTECDDTGWCYPNGPEGGVLPCQTCLTRKRGQAPGVPVDEHGSRLANYHELATNRDALKHAKLWLEGVHPDLYLFGGVGSGKTRLACTLLNERWAAGDRVEFFRVAQLLAAILPGAEDIDATIDRMSRIPVIVLDDVGASQATDFARRMLLVIYEARMDRGHRTIWTSNLDLEELAGFNQDERLSSRIAGHAKVVELDGQDWRLKPVKKRGHHGGR